MRLTSRLLQAAFNKNDVWLLAKSLQQTFGFRNQGEHWGRAIHFRNKMIMAVSNEDMDTTAQRPTIYVYDTVPKDYLDAVEDWLVTHNFTRVKDAVRSYYVPTFHTIKGIYK
jgi:hypothetical protein